MSFEEKYHEYHRAYDEFVEKLYAIQDNFDFDKLFCDDYDGSIEFTEVDNSLRLSPELLDFVLGEGFLKVCVNHKDKWETHYHNDKSAWRVRYSTKVDPSLRHQEWIEVEEFPASWPKEWLDSGYVRIVHPNEYSE